MITEIAFIEEMVKILGAPATIVFLYLWINLKNNQNNKKNNHGKIGKTTSNGLYRIIAKSAADGEEHKSHDEYFTNRCWPLIQDMEDRFDKKIETIGDNQFKLMLAFQRTNPDIQLLDDPSFELTLQRKKQG